MIFQARYSDGYRFLDRAGELLNQIHNEFPLWTVVRLTQQLATLQHAELPLVANFGTSAVDLTWNNKKEMISAAEKSAKSFGEQCQLMYNLAVETLGLSSTRRIGVRFHFLAPADSLEESDRIVCRALESSYQTKAKEVLAMDFVDGTCSLVFEDLNTGLRRIINTSSCIVETPPGSPEFLGFRGVPGSGGLLIDIDTYTRPATGHFPKLTIFIQDQFFKTYGFALKLMPWLVQPRK
jgi:hypothetical protein